MTASTVQTNPGGDGDPEADAAGAMKGGEAQRGDPASAPRPLGRKDPQTTGQNAPNHEGIQTRE